MNRRTLLSATLLPATLALALWIAVPSVAGGGGCHGTGAVATEATSTVVKIDGCTYAPTVNRVPVGTEVTFLNSGTGPHDVTGTMSDWGSGLLGPGQAYRTRFAKPGVYAFSCSLHPGMAGVIVAGAAGPGVVSAAEPVPAMTADDSPTTPAESDAGAPTVALGAAGGVGLLVGAFLMGFLRRRETTD